MKKILILVISTILPIFAFLIAILVAVMLVLDFFGSSTTDWYVKDNIAYASDYKNALNENIQNGYVPLERILYFYLSRDDLNFSKIYSDNLDTSLKRMKPISLVCSQGEYKNFAICNELELKHSNQIDEYQQKIFNKPIDFSKIAVTSFFMEQRYVFGEFDVHQAWDFAAEAQTEVMSVCDGVVEKVSFTYQENVPDTAGGLGNYIVIKCNMNEEIYKITYGHLYPNSKKVNVGDIVSGSQVIGSVGTTGYSTGNHLHYQVQLEDNSYVDGMSFIDFSDGAELPPYHEDYLLGTGLDPLF